MENGNICKRCHRHLKDDSSKRVGFGPVCYHKYLQSKKIRLFEMGAMTDETTKQTRI